MIGTCVNFGTNRKRFIRFPISDQVTFVVSRTVSEIRRLIGRQSPIRTHPTLIQRPRSGFEFWDRT